MNNMPIDTEKLTKIIAYILVVEEKLQETIKLLEEATGLSLKKENPVEETTS